MKNNDLLRKKSFCWRIFKSLRIQSESGKIQTTGPRTLFMRCEFPKTITVSHWSFYCEKDKCTCKTLYFGKLYSWLFWWLERLLSELNLFSWKSCSMEFKKIPIRQQKYIRINTQFYVLLFIATHFNINGH